MRHFIRHSIILPLFFFCSHLSAEENNLFFEKEEALNSLLNYSITSITQDDTGFLWLGTEYGLARFDGYTYLSFYANEESDLSLPGNNIKRIIKTQNGNIWIATDQGIAYMELPGGKVVKPDYCLQFSHLQVNTISEDTEGNLWLGTNDGVKVINPELEMATSILLPLNEDQHSFNVNFIDIDNAGNIWIGSNFGYCAIKKISPTQLFRSQIVDIKVWKAKNRLGFFSIDPFNKLWINSDSRNYVYHITDDRQLTNKTKIDPDIDGKSFIMLSDNRYLIGSRWHGIIELIDNGKNRFVANSQWWMNSKSSTDLSNNINVIFEDRAGNIWAGTKYGLYVHRKSAVTPFHNIKANEQGSYMLSHNAISSIIQTDDDFLWIGTSNGLNQLKLEDGKIPANPSFNYYCPTHMQAEISTPDIAIQCIEEDINNQLWVGTKQGVLLFDPLNKTFKRKDNMEQFFSQNNISLTKTIYRDMQNNIWMGFTYGGLVVYSAAKDECIQIEKFAKNDVWSIAKDQVGNMWIGTRSGLYRFNSNMLLSQISSNTKEYKHKTDDQLSIPANWITAIHIASNGDIWVGTSEGLCKYSPTGDNFDRIDLSENNHPPYISSIVEDLAGRIWISTTGGLFRYEKNNIQYFELAGGNFSSINYTFGHLLTEKGDILFGGISGLTYFNPDEIVPDSTKQSVYFSQLLFPNRNSANRNIDINELSKITLTHSEKQFSVWFSTLNYASTANTKYSYRIQELSNEWIYLDKVNNVSFSNLPKGKYTLEIRSTATSGFWMPQARKLKIVVLPPWWKTSWAYIAYFIIFILLLYLIFQWLRTKEHLQRINELNIYKLTFYTNLLHSFKGPLTLMQAPLNNLIKNHTKMNSSEVEEMLGFLQRNSKRLSHTLMQLLEFRKIDRGKLILHLTNNDIIALLQDIYQSFSELAESKEINFSFTTSIKSQLLTFDFEKIEIVMFNLLSNAFKFTEKGGDVHLSAEVSSSHKDFIISICDTGIGIAPENREKIFERFWQVYNDNPMLVRGTGIGLSLAKDFVEAHHGNIKIESELGKGSCFTVTLPVDNTCFTDQPISTHDNSQIKKAERVAYYVEIENEISVQETEEQKETKEQPIVFILAENKETLNFFYVTLSKEFRVYLFETEDKICNKIKDQVPDLIISEILFQGQQTGLDFCRRIKADIKTSHIPYILLAENSNEDEKLIAYKAGADAYIEKPIDISLLLVRINHILKMRNDFMEKTHRNIITNPQNVSAISQDTKFLQDVMAVIEENMDDEHFMLDDFASSMKMSRSKLNSKMIMLTQQTPIEFVRKVRLKRAAQLLKLNAYSISEVSYMVGISDPRYFSTIFKKQYGVSPLQYTRQKTNSSNMENDQDS